NWKHSIFSFLKSANPSLIMLITRIALSSLRNRSNVGASCFTHRGSDVEYSYSTTSNEQNKLKSKIKLTKDGKLTWNDYFALRRRRRMTERFVTYPSALGSLGASLAYVATREFDPTPIFGQEPFLIYGTGTALCGLTGLLLGPIVGSSIWKFFHREEVKLMEQQIEFLTLSFL
ncbi:16122_t:CDS:2, partial [Acaulospora colombiana]